ncbi:hypothetical protein Tco_1069315 [Tanacetum coccineum]|uniref:Uncharacterized protein n=1 Tax=Tanacetum coccineum TaxID=301880 RepID=A0ABQ5HI59_9ASTR
MNCLQPEWFKYVTNVLLERNIRDDPYDELFDYLRQYEKLVITSRVKKFEKTYDPLTLVADIKDPLTSAMMLLARVITQCYSTPTNNRLCSSSNSRNQAVVQADRVNIQRKMLEMMVDLQDDHIMFKKNLLRVAMFRKRVGMYKELFQLLHNEMLQMFSANIAVQKDNTLVIVQSQEFRILNTSWNKCCLKKG